MKRRDFIRLIGGTAAAWPLAARAQQPALPVVAFINASTADASARLAAAFRKGLSETGHVEGQNIRVEYHWLGGRYEQLPTLVADLARRRVAVIATPGAGEAASAAKVATATIPIVFGVGNDPVKLGLVTNFARPDGNLTGVNFFVQEITSKRLGLLHELVPKASRIAVLVNPANALAAESTVKEAQEAAATLGLQIHVFNAGTSTEIDAAFANFTQQRIEAVLVGGDGFFVSRRVQFATLATRDRLPASYVTREFVEVGGLTSYGTPVADMFRQVGIYAGSIVKGIKPADLPVMQSTRFEFLINLQTAKTLGIEVPPMLLARTDEVVE